MNHATATGKVILFGEHAVVYGVPAIASALSLEVDVEIDDGTGRCVLNSPDGEAVDFSDTVLREGFTALLAGVEVDITKLDITIDSQLPIGAGMGFSAAASVALARAVSARLGNVASAQEAFAMSMLSESAVHGNPSGIDSTISAHGGMRRYLRNQPNATSILDPWSPLKMVVAVSAQHGSTSEQVAQVAAWREANPQEATKVFAEVEQIVDEAETVIESGDMASLGVLMNRNHELLRTMGVSTPDLDRICEIVRDAGALGAKLTGGGGGGAVLALTPDLDTAHAVEDALEAAAKDGLALRGVHRVTVGDDR